MSEESDKFCRILPTFRRLVVLLGRAFSLAGRNWSLIDAQLAGRTIAVTGSTGFLGTALVERLLRSIPDVRLVLIIRAGKRSDVERRAARDIFKNDAFDQLRGRHGMDGFNEFIAERVTVVEGDVGTDGLGLNEAGRAALAGCDTIIHSAATVSFDAALDTAVEVNLLGPHRIAMTLADLGATPHLVSVSTCYVAGNRRGNAPEELLAGGPFALDINWRAEVESARRIRSDLDAQSRTPERLAEFAKAARQELGAAGTGALAAKTEQLRQRWASDALVDAGRARAASLGWPDAYAYTKALGEQALIETRGDVPVSIVRPSIIESALTEPAPGWIRGFRMAEPVLISYARGLLSEFPGVPEGVVDVIPVDLVVNAILAVAARGPLDEPDVTQVASGSANPLRYRQLVELVSGWFKENPIYDRDGQPIIPPEWRFPRRGRVQAQLNRATTGLRIAERGLQALPLRGKQAQLGIEVAEKREMAERAKTYVDLYGAYTQCEAIYQVDQLDQLRLDLEAEGAGPSAAEVEHFELDPRVIDWEDYVRTIHLPSVVESARVKTTPGRTTGPDRSERRRRQILSEERHLAAFDLENTLIASNVVASYAWLATRRLGRTERLKLATKLIAEGPSLLSLDRSDRSDFLRFFYRRYNDAPVDLLAEDAAELFSDLLAKSYPDGIRRVREHRRLGHRTVLITGALDLVVEPLRPLFDDIISAELGMVLDEDDVAIYDGELLDVPPTGESRAAALIDYAKAHDCDLAESVAYADSTSDLPMLEAVGFPVAVNPETRLAAVARKRGWLVEQWTKSPGSPGRLLPIGPRASELRRHAKPQPYDPSAAAGTP